ncbi:MarR family winged helix-turn-helix transcriptional regulator [Faecalicatena contorta]|uniref:MarR family winged helix-turn-helix transcriptional regulator n=1 Tax=Faecalicatena contorta TaxID=39482 RepID=UPI00189AEA76|nr:MarR family transcriptional regulator [Faecalicatena contorta]
MKKEKYSEQFVKNLLLVMPDWHSKLVRPFKETLHREMSLETYYCLETVRKCETVTMTELAQQLKVPKQQATKLVDKLDKYGLIERQYHENDRRMIWLRLTPKATAYLDEYYLKNKDFLRSLEEKLSQEELSRLNEAVEVLGEILPRLE